MNDQPNPIPEEYGAVTPYLIVDEGAADAIAFYRKAFGATEHTRLDGPNGQVMHAELRIGDSMVMLADACPGMGFKGPKSCGGTAVSLCLYVTDVDDVFPRAVAAGATVVKPLEDQFYGDRSGTVTDPFGHVWTIGSRKEILTPEEIRRRAAAAFGEGEQA